MLYLTSGGGMRSRGSGHPGQALDPGPAKPVQHGEAMVTSTKTVRQIN